MNGAELYDQPEFLRGYRQLRQAGLGLNEGLEIPAIGAALPSVAGLRVVDLGCGEGAMAVRLAEAGASEVVAVDASEQMLSRATPHHRVRYVRSDLAVFDLAPGAAELVVSSLALHYVEDIDGLIGRIRRWLTPGGHFVFTIEHPIVTAPRVAAEGVIDDYGDEGPRRRTWFVDGVIKYHRTIGSLVGMLRHRGFRLESLDEPLPTERQVELSPHLARHRRRPPLLLISAVA